MPKILQIDFISDIACPWCVIGLGGLDRALESLRGEVSAEIVFHPFELNPNMQEGGENSLEHITKKYHISTEEARINRERIQERAREVGFIMNTSDSSRVYNTFHAHRLLAWAEGTGKQHALKRQLFILYFTEQKDPGDPRELVGAAEKAGLDPKEASEIIESNQFSDEVRSDEALWRSRGIDAVPAVVVNDRYLISGGQPAEEFGRQLREIARQQVD
jgi:predicted DsbA family dithiol-disulfide isomerase